MPDYEKPKVLKKAEKVVSEDNQTVIEVTHTEYSVDGKKYPKLRIETWKQDDEGFPRARPKGVNLPIELQSAVAHAILSLEE